MYRRIHKPSPWNHLSQEKSSRFAPRPLTAKARQDSDRPPTQEEIEDEAFHQNKLEAFGLKLKEKHGTITPVEQETLGVLQAKMEGFWAQRMERAQALVRSNTIQAKSETSTGSSVRQRPNRTGMPDALKTGVERLSGYSLNDVRVRYNSPKPAQVHARAYTQGTEIHVASGQEEHLPHEAWHVVQQAQGRVKPTMQMRGRVNVNDDACLEREADVMGARAMALRPPAGQGITEQTAPTLKPLAVGPSTVFQMRWIDIDGTNQSYWEGRRPPGPRDFAELESRGRVQVPYPYQSIQNAPNANRPHGLFLAPRDSDQGQIGAPFPLNQPSSDQQMPQQERHEDVSWFHQGVRVQHAEQRRPEQTIHGGVSARQQLQQYGLPDYPHAAWAHIQPDHVTPEDQDREDRAMRHPSTEQANQQHTVREYAQMNAARNLGGLVASRHLHGQQTGRPGLYSSMEFGSTFLTGDETRTHSDEVPFLTQQPGRYGDEDEYAQALNAFGANSIASWLRDQGVLDENDLPDRFYIPADDADSEQEDRPDTPNQESSQPAEPPDTEMQLGTSGNGGGGGRPVIAHAVADTLTLAQMHDHYQAGIVWAIAQGTFSHEFGLFRANAANAFTVLVQAGLSQNAANIFEQRLAAALLAVANHFQGLGQPVPGYLPAGIQDWVFDQIDPNGRALWALLRYINAADDQDNAN